MRRQLHVLPSDVPGTERTIVSHHFGSGRAGPRIYLQSGLHADELPGQLVLWHLIEQLTRRETAAQINGEIVVVPCANPIGLSQGLFWDRIGRFELYSGENFNRHYADLKAMAAKRADGLLCADGQANLAIIRRILREALAEQPTRTELAALRHTLLSLAIDADVVLDLHCDMEAVVHIYTTPAGEVQAQALSRHLGARVILLASDSGGNCFDESCSTPWDSLRERYGDRFPIPAGCFSATVELRGQADVSDPIAAADAAHLLDWLTERGALEGPATSGGFAVAQCVPLAGSQELQAPRGGLLAFHAQVGDRLSPGDPVATIIDPATGERATACSENAGVVYARENRRFVRRGSTIALISGEVARRTGKLLSS
jgi:predicted deacylase